MRCASSGCEMCWISGLAAAGESGSGELATGEILLYANDAARGHLLGRGELCVEYWLRLVDERRRKKRRSG